MIRSIAWALASGISLALSTGAMAQPATAVTQSQKLSGPLATLEADNPSGGLPDLPPSPSAKESTIFGGAIRKIDPVRDQFMLDVYGQRPMKVLFDERTQVYRDGVKIPVHDLSAADHASVQTALDGTGIFAISVHILTSIPQGQFRGRVLRYHYSTGELDLDASPSPRPFKVQVPSTASIFRKGQSSFTAEQSGLSDLRPGALVDVTFVPGAGAPGEATQIAVLAVPGASFVFTGNITGLDLSAGTLVLVDPRDRNSYRIQFAPSEFAGSQNLRVGQRVRLTASYDGSSYIASEITTY